MQEQDLIYDWNAAGDAVDYRALKNVELDDETLRDGLQCPSVNDPSIADKIEILHLMAELGIHTANIGLPGAGPRAVGIVASVFVATHQAPAWTAYAASAEHAFVDTARETYELSLSRAAESVGGVDADWVVRTGDVVESLAEELEGIVGPAVYVELRRRLGDERGHLSRPDAGEDLAVREDVLQRVQQLAGRDDPQVVHQRERDRIGVPRITAEAEHERQHATQCRDQQ